MKKTVIHTILLLLFGLASCNYDGYSSRDDEGIMGMLGLSNLGPFSVSGNIQKGPFIAGSSITIYELNDDLNQTGLSYNTTTSDDFGSFSYPKEIQTRFAEITAEGYYYNEVSGSLSDSELSLSAIVDLRSDEVVHVNILTTLARERIKYLVMEEGKSFSRAQIQARNEIMAIFNITGNTVNFDQMDISQTGDTDAMLLAISASLQGEYTVAELSELIAHISIDIKEDGVLDNQAYLNAIIGNAFNLDCYLIGQDLVNRYYDLGLTITAPDMEKYMKDILAPRNIVYSWAKTFGGVHDESGRGIAVDNTGNIYVTGNFLGPDPVNFAADWGGSDIKTPVASGVSYGFITKINNNGTYGWTRMIGNGAEDWGYDMGGYDVATDSNGNVYVGGKFIETVNFAADWGGTDNKTATGPAGAFIMKINSDGTYGWTRFLGSGGTAAAYDVEVDGSDAVYVAGGSSGNINFAADWSGTDNKTLSGSFVTKIGSDGGYLWTKMVKSGFRSSMTLDRQGNIFIAGYFVGTSAINFAADWGGTDNKSRITSAYADVYLVKIKSNGTYGWARVIGAGLADSDMSTSKKPGIITDSSNNIYVSDSFRGTGVNFAADWSGSDAKTSNGAGDAFVTRINSGGTYGWTRVFGGIMTDFASTLIADGDDGLYVAGRFTDTVNFGKDWGGFDVRSSTAMANPGVGYLMKIKTDGSYGWTRVTHWIADEIVIDNQGSLLLTGGFGLIESKENFADDFGGNDIKQSRQNDVVLVKLSLHDAGTIVPGNTYGWTKVINASNFSIAYATASDSSGNVYFSGLFMGSSVNFAADWGGNDARSATDDTPFITKMLSGGGYGWTRIIPTGNNDNAVSIEKIALDAGDNVYVTGRLLGSNVNFAADWGGSDIKSSSGDNDFFIMKINANGTYGWTRLIGGADNDWGKDIAIDRAGNIYLMGAFCSPSINFAAAWGGSDVKTLVSGYDVSITKINAAGNYVWTKILAINEPNWMAMATDPINNLLVTGCFQDTVNFAEAWGGNDSLTAGGLGGDIFITKILNNGSYGWTKKIGGTKGDGADDIAIDTRGNIYITGFYQSPSVNFGAAWGKNDTRMLEGMSNVFVTKINSDCTYGWTRTWGNNFAWGNGVALDSNDTVYLTGRFQDTNMNFARDFGLSDIRSINGVNGYSDAYLMRINRDGTYGWTKSFGGDASSVAGADEGVEIAIDNGNSVYLTGTIGGGSQVNFSSGWGINDIEDATGHDTAFLQMINP